MINEMCSLKTQGESDSSWQGGTIMCINGDPEQENSQQAPERERENGK